MSLKENLEKDFIEAYKAHEEMRISVLRMVKSSIKNAEINLKKVLSDDDIIKILRREIKQREESIDGYRKGGREELVPKDEAEIKIIETYLPAQMSEADLEKIVSETISALGASQMSDMGRVIGAVMARVGSNADGSTVSALVKQKLSS